MIHCCFKAFKLLLLSSYEQLAAATHKAYTGFQTFCAKIAKCLIFGFRTCVSDREKQKAGNLNSQNVLESTGTETG